jgi:hypothetical protein
MHVRHEAFWLTETAPSTSNVMIAKRDVEDDRRPEIRLAPEKK